MRRARRTAAVLAAVTALVAVAVLAPTGVGVGPRTVSASSTSGSVGGLKVLGSTGVGLDPGLASVDPVTGEVDVANAGSTNVSVLDGLLTVGNVSISSNGSSPFGLLYNPVDTDTFLTYHAYIVPHQVTILYGPVALGGQRLTSVGGVTASDEPVLGAYDPYTNLVYLTDDGATPGAMVVGPSNETRFATVAFSGDPRDVSVDPTNGWAYVAGLGSNNVTYLSGYRSIGAVTLPTLYNASDAVLHIGSSTAYTPYYTSELAFDPADGEMYVADAGSAQVSVLSSGLVQIVSNVSVGQAPYAVAYDPADGDVYVTELNSSAVVVLRGTSVVATVPVGLDPIEVTYDPGDGDMLVANLNSSNVSVLNGTTDLGAVTVGTGPNEIVYDPSNHDAYVVNYASANVTVLGVTAAAGKGPGAPPWIWIGVALLVLLGILAVIVLASRRRGRKGTAAAAAPPTPGTVAPPALPSSGGTTSPPPPSGG